MREPRITLVRTTKLRPRSRNPRTHSKKQIGQIANSILRFGWTYPILVDEDFEIIAGFARWKAAHALKLGQVPVLVMAGLSDAKKRALALADNKIPANAGWDRALLAAELGELAELLPQGDLSLEITGFEAAEIDALMGYLVDPEQDPADYVPDVSVAPVSRNGYLWLLGTHRLLCGDARVDDHFVRLLGDRRASMAFIDAPYNLPVSFIGGRGKIKHREFVQASGELSPSEYASFLATVLTLAARHSVQGSVHFVCMDWRHCAEMLIAGGQVYTELKNLIVWVKTNAGQGSFYRSQHEFIFAFKNGDGAHINNFELGQHGRNRSNVWTYPGVNTFRAGRMQDLTIHPTVKPVALVADAIRDCSRRGDIVLDPFMGSGTTIMAAERVGRRGYGLEIDPIYVDAAVRRWQSFTRRDAILAGTDKTFDEVAAARPSTSERK
jgi:DNA modification methylase